MTSIYHKWNTSNPATGEARFGVRYYDKTARQWIVRLKVGSKSLFSSEKERDAWLDTLRKKERKERIRDLH